MATVETVSPVSSIVRVTSESVEFRFGGGGHDLPQGVTRGCCTLWLYFEQWEIRIKCRGPRYLASGVDKTSVTPAQRPLIIISELTPWYQNRHPENCLLLGEQNAVWKYAQVLVFETLVPSRRGVCSEGGEGQCRRLSPYGIFSRRFPKVVKSDY